MRILKICAAAICFAGASTVMATGQDSQFRETVIVEKGPSFNIASTSAKSILNYRQAYQYSCEESIGNVVVDQIGQGDERYIIDISISLNNADVVIPDELRSAISRAEILELDFTCEPKAIGVRVRDKAGGISSKPKTLTSFFIVLDSAKIQEVKIRN